MGSLTIFAIEKLPMRNPECIDWIVIEFLTNFILKKQGQSALKIIDAIKSMPYSYSNIIQFTSSTLGVKSMPNERPIDEILQGMIVCFLRLQAAQLDFLIQIPCLIRDLIPTSRYTDKEPK